MMKAERLTQDEKVLIDADKAWWARSELFNIIDDLKHCVKSIGKKSDHAYTATMYRGCKDAIWFLDLAEMDVKSAIKQLWAVCTQCKMFKGEALNKSN